MIRYKRYFGRYPWILLPALALLPAALACHTTTRTATVVPESAIERESAPSPEPEADAAIGGDTAPEAAAEEPKEETPASPPSAGTYDNTIKWATASEVDNFGFDVYRGDSEDGPFERLNAEIIEGGGTTDEPRNYRFVDDTIDPYKTYYYVEAISMNSVRERFTPVGKAGPKIKPKAGEAEPADTGG